MKLFRRLLILLFVLNCSVCVCAQTTYENSLYEKAYQEIYDMLEGKTKVSLKRAVYISEWTYLNGNLDYNVHLLCMN